MDSAKYEALLEQELGNLLDNIVVYDEIDSSNTEAMRMLDRKDFSSHLVVARSQTAGRGRRGRQWISPRDSGIYISLLRKVEAGQESIAGLSLVTALSVWQTLADINAEGIELKWPNDVLHKGSKLAGILLECRPLPRCMAVVFGIGVNLSYSQQEQAQVDRELVNLESLVAAPVGRVELIALLVRHLWQAVDQYCANGFAMFQQTWNEADRFMGQDVVIDSGSERLTGKHCGVDKDGALLLDTAAGRQRIAGGEVFPSLAAVQ